MRTLKELTHVLNAEIESMRQSAAALTAVPDVAPVAAAPAAAADDTLVQALEAKIAQRDREAARLREQIAELEKARPQRDERRESALTRMQEWQSRMREQDPEEFERRRLEGRERLGNLSTITSDRLAFMKTIPTEGLAPKYLENHKALLERLEFFNGAMAQIAADPEGPAAMALMPQIFQNMRGLDEMLVLQREVLLDDLARDIGYDEQGTRDFIETVNYITEVTTLPSPGFMRRGGRGRPQAEP